MAERENESRPRVDPPAVGRAGGQSPGETAAMVDRILASPRAARLGLDRPALARLPPAAVRQVAGQLGLAPGGGPGPGGIGPLPLAPPGRPDRPPLGTAPKRDGWNAREEFTRAIGRLRPPKARGGASPGRLPGVSAPVGAGRAGSPAGGAPDEKNLVPRIQPGAGGKMLPLPPARLPEGTVVPGITGPRGAPGRPGDTRPPVAAAGIVPRRSELPAGRDTSAAVGPGRAGTRAPAGRTTTPPGPGASLPDRPSGGPRVARPGPPADRRPDRVTPEAGRVAVVPCGATAPAPVGGGRPPSRPQAGPPPAGRSPAAGGAFPAGGPQSAPQSSRLPGVANPSGPVRAPRTDRSAAPPAGPTAAPAGPRPGLRRPAEQPGRPTPAGRPKVTRDRRPTGQPQPAPPGRRAAGPGSQDGVPDERQSDPATVAAATPRPAAAFDEGRLEDLVRRLVERIVSARLAELERRLGLANTAR